MTDSRLTWLLADVKTRRQQLENEDRAAIEKRAQEAADAGVFSVTDKTALPPGGTRHDYWSMGPYWWPNPNTSDGLPYIRRDGEVNPAVAQGQFDTHRTKHMIASVSALTDGWVITRNPDYARQAHRLVQTFFLDPAKRMNPSLTYGQSIPGICDGRGIGIIETSSFLKLVNNALIFETENLWPQQDCQALRTWFSQYLDWLLTSAHGLEERRQGNNHGTWMDAQLAAYALYANRPAVARQIILQIPSWRIDTQIAPDGSQPHELARTRTFDYSIFNLEAFVSMAVMGRHVGVDLWQYTSPTGGSIKAALNYMAPYADETKAWPFQQIDPHQGEPNLDLNPRPHQRLKAMLQLAAAQCA